MKRNLLRNRDSHREEERVGLIELFFDLLFAHMAGLGLSGPGRAVLDRADADRFGALTATAVLVLIA